MKILCAVDGSECSKWGVEALGALAEQVLHSAVLIHVAGPGPRTSAAGRAGPAKRAAADKAGMVLLRQAAQTARLALGQSVTAPRTAIETVLAHGSPGERLVRESDRHRVNLLVVGSRGFSDLRGFLLGSVSRTVVSLASRPVLVVKRPIEKLAHIVLAVDGSSHAAAAARFVRRGLIPTTAQVTVVSVVPPILNNLAARAARRGSGERLTSPEEVDARRLVSAYRELLLKEDFSVRAEVLEGHPGQTLVDYAERTQPDLLVVGSRGKTRTKGFPLGSVSERVLQDAPCSLLVVRSVRA